MTTLTFAYDVQLNDNEDYIAEGTKVTISSNPYHLNRHKGYTPVIITSAHTYKGKAIKIDSQVEWFNNQSFIELRK